MVGIHVILCFEFMYIPYRMILPQHALIGQVFWRCRRRLIFSTIPYVFIDTLCPCAVGQFGQCMQTCLCAHVLLVNLDYTKCVFGLIWLVSRVATTSLDRVVRQELNYPPFMSVVKVAYGCLSNSFNVTLSSATGEQQSGYHAP